MRNPPWRSRTRSRTHRIHHLPRAAPDYGMMAPPPMLLVVALVALLTGVERGSGLNTANRGFEYEYHRYDFVQTATPPEEAIFVPGTIVNPSAPASLPTNLTIDTAEENQVVSEFAQPSFAWLPIILDPQGRPEWVVYDVASGTTLRRPVNFSTFGTERDGLPLAAAPVGFAVGGSLDRNSTWFRPRDSSPSNGIVLHKLPIPYRSTFRDGDSYYHVSRERFDVIEAHAHAATLDFLSYPGRVASIETAAENRRLAAVLRDAGVAAAWIGAVRGSNTEGRLDAWEWGTETDGTRKRVVFTEPFETDDCVTPVTILPGSFHNLTAAGLLALCRRSVLGVLLTDQGEWVASLNALEKHPLIAEFATSRDYTGTVFFRDKAFRSLTRSTLHNATEARALAAQSRLTHVLAAPPLVGHLPLPTSLAEHLLIAQVAAHAQPQGMDRVTRVFLGLDFDPALSVYSVAYGPFAGEGQGLFASLSAVVPYAPHRASNLPLLDNDPECAAIEGPSWRVGSCSVRRSSLVAQFDLGFVGGKYYIGERFFAGMLGAQQRAGTRLARYTAHVPTLRSSAEAQTFGQMAFLAGNGNRFVNSLGRNFGDQFLWFDGTPAGQLLSSSPEPVQDNSLRCLAIDPINAAIASENITWRRVKCRTDRSPLLLEYSLQPLAPQEVPLTNVCDYCECDAATKSLECVTTGTLGVPIPAAPETFESVNWSLNRIERLTRQDLRHFLRLQELTALSNSIVTVEDDAFVDLADLSVVQLSSNYITELPKLEYTRLRTLDLSNNNIRTLPRGRFPPTLTQLVLDNNLITALDAGIFDGLALEVLRVSTNRIATLDRLVFARIPAAARIVLFSNPCACTASGGSAVSSCPVECTITQQAVATTAGPPGTRTGGSSGAGLAVGLGVGVAVAVLLAALVVAARRQRKGAHNSKVQVDPRGAWSDDASSSALCAGDMSSFAVVEEEAVTALMGARISQDSLELGQPLGSGAFGEVFRGRGRSGRIAGMEVAVKTLATTERDARDVFMKEASLQLELQHPHIVTLLGVCMNPGRGPMIVMELMPRGDLRQHLVKETASGRAPETAALTSWCEQVCSAMAYLETKRILHRDIAARNVLLSGELVAKLADLGLARMLSGKDYYRKLSDDRVPLKWMAPESIVDKVYVIRSDVWSFGVLLFETFSLGGKPYPNMTAAETVKFVLGGNRLPAPFGMPEEIARLMQHCWQHEPYARPSFAELHASLQSTLASNEEESVL